MEQTVERTLTETEKPDARARALIMTVGIPTDPKVDIAEALLEEFHRIEPDELVLLASKESFANAERLRDMAGLESGRCTIVEFKSAHNINDVFRKVNEAIDALADKGIGREEIAINFTSGTKIMGSGAVLSAVFNRVLELRYLTGVESHPTRKKRLIKALPGAVFAFQDLLRARSLALELRFRSAVELMENIDDSLLSDRDRGFRADLLLIAHSYDQRESFHPERFLENYPDLKFESPLLEPFRLREDQLEALGELSRELRDAKPGRYVLMDLYNNGLRRLSEGDADDAVIRLYRALELLAQWVLRRDFDIDTNNVDTRRIPPRDRVAFEAMRSVEDGMVKVGLRKAYDLLIVLETALGRRFRESRPMHEFLQRRSGSILAHGLTPMSIADARRLFDASLDMFKVEVEDFDRACELLQFPWIGCN